ncbi:hypothetical protein B0H63DRAFT_508351 [Podospora didyma]|uniref:Uncharacterized protein n=1 Tax=Podospora didyma TaxID=330526 RepID=A0AAE0P0R9_9PEZI|nr:hypothetical protein B0H63DRAFT_508351 [Podospora didyma]
MIRFEIAGIVLATFSVLEDAGKDSQGLIQKRSRVAFLQNLEYLPVSVDISDEQKLLLMEDPHCRLWHDLEIQFELRRRITAPYYGWYISVLSDLQEALKEITEFLPIQNPYHVNAGGIDNVIFRAKSSFSFCDGATHYRVRIEKVEDDNDEPSLVSAQADTKSIVQQLPDLRKQVIIGNKLKRITHAKERSF